METIETLIPDNEDNHLVVVLYFYDDNDKTGTFQIPQELSIIGIDNWIAWRFLGNYASIRNCSAYSTSHLISLSAVKNRGYYNTL